MSTRKRSRPSLNSLNDEDELSPSKPTPAPLSSVKKRKLNTYGKKPTSLFEKLAGKLTETFLGFGQSGGEKENGTEEEKDELAEDHEDDQEDRKVDIWDAPDDEITSTRKRSLKGTPVSSKKATPVSQRKGSAKSAKQSGSVKKKKKKKKDVYEVDDSEEDHNAFEPTIRSRSTPQIVLSTNKKDLEIPMPKSKVGRPRKRAATEEAVVVPGRTPMGKQVSRKPENVAAAPKSPGRPRKSDILKKAKALSREAMFQQMVEEGARAAAKESEMAQTSRRRRSDRTAQLMDTNEEIEDLEPQKTARVKGRPKNDVADELREGPKGILTPTKNRLFKSKKSVAFETHNDVDLGFKDLPDSAKMSSKSSTLESSAKTSPVSIPVENAQSEVEESEEDDEAACAVCKGLESKKGNEMILCENCDVAVHLKCYELPKVPKGDWYCRDCQPDEEFLNAQAHDHVSVDEILSDLPEIEDLEGHLKHMQRLLLDRLTGQKRIKLRGHDDEVRKVHQIVEQTVLAGEGNSMLVIGARGCGKTTLVESVISDLSTDHREKFHVVRLNGFIHTDDKLALKAIWRQLGREMDAEEEMTGKSNHADTLATLLALLSHPSEISEDRAAETAKSVVFVLDEFDLFTTHPRQTLLYNLFDIAQARKAPIVVLGLTTRIDVVETLEKRVKSRFSHRYVHLSLPKSLPAFWEICKEGLLVGSEDLGQENFDLGTSGKVDFVSFWQSMIEDIYNKDSAFKQHLQSHFYRAKSVPTFFTSCILPIANLSPRSLPLTGRKFTTGFISLSAPDSKLHILQGLSELELALLIAAARLDIILDTDTCNFAMAYDEYSTLTSRHKMQTSSAGVTALGASAKIWGREVALGAWERLADYNLLVPAGFGGGSAKDFGAGGRMWKVDVGLEEITGSIERLSGVMAKWCREI